MTTFKKNHKYFSHSAHSIVFFVGMVSTPKGTKYMFEDICDSRIIRSAAQVETDIVDYAK